MDCDRGPDLVKIVRLGRRSNRQTRGVQGLLMSECSESAVGAARCCWTKHRSEGGQGQSRRRGKLLQSGRRGIDPTQAHGSATWKRADELCVLKRKDGVLWD